MLYLEYYELVCLVFLPVCLFVFLRNFLRHTHRKSLKRERCEKVARSSTKRVGVSMKFLRRAPQITRVAALCAYAEQPCNLRFWTLRAKNEGKVENGDGGYRENQKRRMDSFSGCFPYKRIT